MHARQLFPRRQGLTWACAFYVQRVFPERKRRHICFETEGFRAMTIDAVGAGRAFAASPRPGNAPGPPGVPRVESSQAPPAREPDKTRPGKAETAAPSATTKAAREFSKDLHDATAGLTETRLSILYDDDADLFITRSVEKRSGDVVRQYPYEKQVERIRYFLDQLRDAREERVDETV
jgi:uncharacterized FlaG/YvyC family protein